jgi:hypothetical protein
VSEYEEFEALLDQGSPGSERVRRGSEPLPPKAQKRLKEHQEAVRRGARSAREGSTVMGEGMDRETAQKRAKELGGVARAVRRENGHWVIGGDGPKNNDRWIVLAQDLSTILDDGSPKPQVMREEPEPVVVPSRSYAGGGKDSGLYVDNIYLSDGSDLMYLFAEGDEPYEVQQNGSRMLHLSWSQAEKLRDKLSAELSRREGK